MRTFVREKIVGMPIVSYLCCFWLVTQSDGRSMIIASWIECNVCVFVSVVVGENVRSWLSVFICFIYHPFFPCLTTGFKRFSPHYKSSRPFRPQIIFPVTAPHTGFILYFLIIIHCKPEADGRNNNFLLSHLSLFFIYRSSATHSITRCRSKRYFLRCP